MNAWWTVRRSPSSERRCRDAFPEVEGQVYVDLLDGVYRTGEPFVGHEIPLRLDRRDGASKDLYLNFVYAATRGVDGEIDGVFAHIIDVTDMVQARKRVEESERQFRTLAETIPHLAWMADESGQPPLVQPPLVRLYRQHLARR